MRASTWLAFALSTVFSSALVIPTADDVSYDAAVAAVAGSIGRSHLFNVPARANQGHSAQANSTHLSHPTKTDLELEYEKLETLKAQLRDLHHEVMKQEREIFTVINRDFGLCSGVRCYLQTALKKAPDFFEFFKHHFKYPSKDPSGFWSCPWSSNSSKTGDEKSPFSFDDSGDQPSPADHAAFDFNGGDDEKSTFDVASDADTHDDSPFDFGSSPSPPETESFSSTGDEDEQTASHPSFQPGPGHHPDNHDNSFPHHPSYDPSKPNSVPPASHPQESGIHSSSKPHHERPPFRMPHPAPRHRHFDLILATGGLLISLVVFIVLFKALRLYCANPRVRAERAARIEECRTRREYRRAAVQHRFRQCLSRFRRRSQNPDTDDYEEKRAVLRARDIENHIIGADINSLCRAHEAVDQLIGAEEGQLHNFSFASHHPTSAIPTHHPHHHHTQPEVIASSSRSVRSTHTSTTLPPYAPLPPRYNQDLALEPGMQIVDGFRCTPSQSAATVASSASSFILDDDVTTESSVVDCSSRLSMETETDTDMASMRYAPASVPPHASVRMAASSRGR